MFWRWIGSPEPQDGQQRWQGRVARWPSFWRAASSFVDSSQQAVQCTGRTRFASDSFSSFMEALSFYWRSTAKRHFVNCSTRFGIPCLLTAIHLRRTYSLLLMVWQFFIHELTPLGIQFLPVDKNVYLRIQSFVNLAENTFEHIHVSTHHCHY